MQNGICESFNGRMRDELLNETLFFPADHDPPVGHQFQFQLGSDAGQDALEAIQRFVERLP